MSKSKAKKKAKELENYLKNEQKIKDAGFTQVNKKGRKNGYLCPKCNTIFYAHRKQVVKNPICRNCMTGASYGEQVVINILTSNNILFEKEKTFSKLKGLGNGKLRFDFYIKKPNGDCFIIEVDGEQHSKGEWAKNTKEHDNIKNKFCVDNNIRLYRVKYIFGKLQNISNSILSILKNEGFKVDCNLTTSYTLVDKSNITKPKSTKTQAKTNKKEIKYYAIKKGRKNNKIVTSWNECKKLVHKYPNAKFKGFNTEEEARKYLKI